MSLADLTLVTRGNEVHWVGVFILDRKSVGAFAAGPTVGLRLYYRGGNSSGIEEAIQFDPHIRIVCLRRPREEVVASFCRVLD